MANVPLSVLGPLQFEIIYGAFLFGFITPREDRSYCIIARWLSPSQPEAILKTVKLKYTVQEELKVFIGLRNVLAKALHDYDWWNLCQSNLNFHKDPTD